jgi:uncharacterized protein YdaU (DUF1376 family)
MSRGDSPMPLHVGDFLSAVIEWDALERGVYLLLLAHQWAAGSIPSDPREWAPIVGFKGETQPGKKGGKSWGKVVGKVMGKFPEVSEGRRQNLRLEQHRQAVETKRQANRERAGKGAKGRWSPDAPSMPPYQTIPIEELREEHEPEFEHPFPETQTVTKPQPVEGIPLQLAIETTPIGKKKLSEPPIVPEVIDYLPGLNREAFGEWLEYRRKRKPAVKPASYQSLMRRFVSLGDEQLQALTVEHCIANGYQGLWEIKPTVPLGNQFSRKGAFERHAEHLNRMIEKLERDEP